MDFELNIVSPHPLVGCFIEQAECLNGLRYQPWFFNGRLVRRHYDFPSLGTKIRVHLLLGEIDIRVVSY